MTQIESTATASFDARRRRDEFHDDILAGLARDPKQLPCKYFYDKRGSRLFDQICELDEYYLTRAELEIMRRHGAAIANQIASGAMVVEFGSGSGVKTRVLLEHLRGPAAYVPVDISGGHLRKAAAALADEFPTIEVLPIVADFTQQFTLPQASRRPARVVVYFPGSTIGNFPREQALSLLARMASLAGEQGGLLIGIDLQKDPEVLEAAYNDSAGVTAAFNLNLLARINRELDGDFHLERFRHVAVYHTEAERIEVFLISQCDQLVSVAGHPFQLHEQERILTEYSHKYTRDGFAALAQEAGLVVQQTWTDSREAFAVCYLVPRGA